MDWLQDEIKDYMDDYLIFDCPGQIELYSHIPVMKTLVRELEKLGYQVCGVYCLDSTFIEDGAKFIAGTFMCLSAMVITGWESVLTTWWIDSIGDSSCECIDKM